MALHKNLYESSLQRLPDAELDPGSWYPLCRSAHSREAQIRRRRLFWPRHESDADPLLVQEMGGHVKSSEKIVHCHQIMYASFRKLTKVPVQ
jgi:hypothetical protein